MVRRTYAEIFIKICWSILELLPFKSQETIMRAENRVDNQDDLDWLNDYCDNSTLKSLSLES